MPTKVFNVGDTVYVKFYVGGTLHPQYKYLPRVVTKVPKGSRKRYQLSAGGEHLTNRWAYEILSKEELVAKRLME